MHQREEREQPQLTGDASDGRGDDVPTALRAVAREMVRKFVDDGGVFVRARRQPHGLVARGIGVDLLERRSTELRVDLAADLVECLSRRVESHLTPPWCPG
jgi:hypothetical protein